ncbi:hypothetical protein [Helicobacter sp.]|uniref:hypothetical protein n=1 Tax=Helicobacter sp. TaxID=218 RepID=UPI002A74980B|nr:hypothetical protein [Helicobacter sp.]MDY2585309.1 hypothetical protein [Helicobacter sp.]
MALSHATQKGVEQGIDLENFTPAINAKTPSFFALKGFFGISKEMEQDLLKFGDSCKESVRYCLHNSPQDSLHIMLIYHPYKKAIPQQIFEHTDSYYLLEKGAFKLTNLDTNTEIVLSQKQCKIAKIAKGVCYQMEILSDSLLFIEVRERNTATTGAGGGGG